MFLARPYIVKINQGLRKGYVLDPIPVKKYDNFNGDPVRGEINNIDNGRDGCYEYGLFATTDS